MAKNVQMFRSVPDVIGIKELKSILGIGKAAAYSLVESGQISSFRIGRTYKIAKTELIRFVCDQS